MVMTKLLLLLCSFNLYAGEISLSFDDAPMRDMALLTGTERTNRIIDTLKKHRIQTVFFSNSSKLNRGNGLERMKLYDRNGHIIANHTHSHTNFDDVSLDDYIIDFERANTALKKFNNFKPWFRFPYLKHGREVAKRNKFRNYLSSKGYDIGFVTVDTQDWFMASLVDKHVRNGGSIDEDETCRVYTDMIWASITAFENSSVKHLNKSVSHSLLLHENDLAGLCLDKLLEKIKSEGWKVVSPITTMEDPIYKIRPNTLFTNNGQVAALVHEETEIKIYDPWSFPWNNGKLIKDEFNRRNILLKE
jgi:peptidoglycan/xylan/chitin deacetylase (PgdA/CDA1 family)